MDLGINAKRAVAAASTSGPAGWAILITGVSVRVDGGRFTQLQ